MVQYFFSSIVPRCMDVYQRIRYFLLDYQCSLKISEDLSHTEKILATAMHCHFVQKRRQKPLWQPQRNLVSQSSWQSLRGHYLVEASPASRTCLPPVAVRISKWQKYNRWNFHPSPADGENKRAAQMLVDAFVDFVKVFDTVNRELLFIILGKLGCPPQFIRIIKKLHTNVHTCYRW